LKKQVSGTPSILTIVNHLNRLGDLHLSLFRYRCEVSDLCPLSERGLFDPLRAGLAAITTPDD
jgi:hypothetical protein